MRGTRFCCGAGAVAEPPLAVVDEEGCGVAGPL